MSFLCWKEKNLEQMRVWDVAKMQIVHFKFDIREELY